MAVIRVITAAGIIAVAALLALATMYGQESHVSYSGNALASLDSTAFADDSYFNSDRPTLASLFYVLGPLAGDHWLDDRFSWLIETVVFVLLLASCWLVSKRLGLQNRAERLAVLALVCIPSPLLDIDYILMGSGHQFNPTLIAHPLALLAVLTAILQRHWLLWAGLAIATAAFSVKTAWFAMLVQLFVVANHFGRRGRFAATAFVSFGLVVAWVGSRWVLLGGDSQTAATLWVEISSRENGEANIFRPNNTLAGGASFAVLLIGAMAISWRRRSQLFDAGLFITFAVAMIVWLGSGFYLTFAPPLLQVPHLVPFSPNRAMWLPQLLAYLVVAAQAFRWLGAGGNSVQKQLAAAATLTALLVAPVFSWPFSSVSRIIGVVLMLVVAWVAIDRFKLKTTLKPLVAAIFFFAVVGGIFMSQIQQRLPAYEALATKGALGDNISAQWVSLSQWLREHAAGNASVLAFVPCAARYRDDIDPSQAGHCDSRQLIADPSIRSRSGLATPVPSFYDPLFSADAHAKLRVQWHRLDALAAAIAGDSLQPLVASLKELPTPPDYLVVPVRYSAALATVYPVVFEDERFVTFFMK